jgi:ceramide glucosyltransferase
VILSGILASLALLSLGLTLWQWLAARNFRFEQRVSAPSFTPPVTLLKPLHGADDGTEECLRSWLKQDYPVETQILFGVASGGDPVCDVVRKLIKEFPQRDLQLVNCPEDRGANPKVSKLIQLEKRAKHEVLVLSDADVVAPEDCLRNLVAPLGEVKVGIANCFYRMRNPATLAMRWEAVAINADFWSQVLQARTMGPLKFALGATLAVRREALQEMGGFAALADCLADDYQLGKRIAARGYRIELCPVVVDCREGPRGWVSTWRHQLRWARTIRVCQPAAYFASILSNATLWSLLWLAVNPSGLVVKSVVALLVARLIVAGDLMSRLTRSRVGLADLCLVFGKDLLQVGLWLAAFLGNRIEWRGEQYRVQSDGGLRATTLRTQQPAQQADPHKKIF